MTQEEKQLLLKDLCARLPYGIIIAEFDKYDNQIKEFKLKMIGDCGYLEYDACRDGEQSASLYSKVTRNYCKPYLRPMSSMTEEEKKELKEISDEYLDKWMSVNDPSVRCELDAKISSKRAEFYNSHYLDWNGLIEKGLALEAPKDMYKTE